VNNPTAGQPLNRLSVSSLRSIAGALRDGSIDADLSGRALKQITGPHSSDVESYLMGLFATGMTPAQAARLVEAVAESKAAAVDPSLLIDLVLSGPDVPGVPTGDTAATISALIESAKNKIMLIGYAVHNGEKLFARLAERMAGEPGLRVIFCLDISRAWQDSSLPSEIVRRFEHEFKTKHWPGKALPELYYDPRSLEMGHENRSCLHAKCVIIDRAEALVTSANFTEAAQERNIEVGIKVRHKPLVERLASYFEALIETGQLVRFGR
jgi:hypothetical protein